MQHVVVVLCGCTIIYRKLLCRKYFANATEGPIKRGMTVKVEAQFAFNYSIVVVGLQPTMIKSMKFKWLSLPHRGCSIVFAENPLHFGVSF